MSAIVLCLDGSPAPPVAPALPHRYSMSTAALDELARRTDTVLPWHGRGTGRSLVERSLGGPAVRRPEVCAPVDELHALGLLSTTGELDAHVVDALACFSRPEVFVEVDLGVRRADPPGGLARFRAWHRHRGSHVAAVSQIGSRVELAWWLVDDWAGELERLATPAPQAAGPVAPPAGYLRLPYELLLGAGAALRLQRPAVLDDLLGRHCGRFTDRDGIPFAPAAAADQLRRLHTAERGRLQLSVVGVETDHSRTVGLLTWVLFADGWRELVPLPRAGESMVEVHQVRPSSLGGLVARMVLGARP